MFQQRLSEDEWLKILGSNSQRASWLIDKDWTGPYEEEFKSYISLIDIVWRNYVTMTGIIKQYNPDTYVVSMGIHRYNPNIKGVGLKEHYDDGILSIIHSNEPLEGFIDGEWKTISIPEDHVMVIVGLESFFATAEPSLLHRVPHCTKEKFTISAFIGANPVDKLVVHENISIPDNVSTINDFRESLYSGNFIWKTAE